MTTEISIHQIAEAVKIKVDLLSWIGILPEPHSTLHGLEIRAMQKVLVEEDHPEELQKEAERAIPQMNFTMNEGIEIITRKLETQECIECGKCDDLKDVLQMLLDEKPNDQIKIKIKEYFGDITVAKGAGMPGHQDEGHPHIRAIEVGGGPEALLDMIKMIASGVDDPDDFAIIGGRPTQNPNRAILEKIVSRGRDKDKLH